MNKKKIFTLIGVMMAVLAMSSSALACHLFTKKNAESKNSNNTCEEKQNSDKKKDNIECDCIKIPVAMYGIPIYKDINKSDINDNEIIEKYAIPNEFNDPPLLKYAVPNYTENENIPVLKYATPYFPNENINKNPEDKSIIDSNSEKISLPKYALPESESETNNLKKNNVQDKDKNPWK